MRLYFHPQGEEMAYCKKCGAELDDEAVFCPKCGAQQGELKTSSDDDGSILWLLLGFLIPIVGLIRWIIWKDDKPQSARMAGIGALVSVIIGVVMIVPVLMMFGMFAWH